MLQEHFKEHTRMEGREEGKEGGEKNILKIISTGSVVNFHLVDDFFIVCI